MAVVYADGTTAGDEDLIAQILDTRRKAAQDIPIAIQVIEEAMGKGMDRAALKKQFEEMGSVLWRQGASEPAVAGRRRMIPRLAPSFVLSLLKDPAEGVEPAPAVTGQNLIMALRELETRINLSRPVLQ